MAMRGRNDPSQNVRARLDGKMKHQLNTWILANYEQLKARKPRLAQAAMEASAALGFTVAESSMSEHTTDVLELEQFWPTRAAPGEGKTTGGGATLREVAGALSRIQEAQLHRIEAAEASIKQVEVGINVHEKDITGTMRRHMALEKRVAHLEDIVSQFMLSLVNQSGKQNLHRLHDAHKAFVMTARDEAGS